MAILLPGLKHAPCQRTRELLLQQTRQNARHPLPDLRTPCVERNECAQRSEPFSQRK
jgi:hypothetical protein